MQKTGLVFKGKHLFLHFGKVCKISFISFIPSAKVNECKIGLWRKITRNYAEFIVRSIFLLRFGQDTSDFVGRAFDKVPEISMCGVDAPVAKFP